jgi:ATP-dependent Lhr-like helicase
VLITTINGQPAAASSMGRYLMDAGFHPGPLGMNLRRIPSIPGYGAPPASSEVQ